MERKKITEAMIWCVDHADGSEEVSKLLCNTKSSNGIENHK